MRVSPLTAFADCSVTTSAAAHDGVSDTDIDGLAQPFVLLYVLLAGLLGFIGYRKFRAVRPPERAIHQAQETKSALANRG